jgi:regulator of cell morphogenesis and NO signaling
MRAIEPTTTIQTTDTINTIVAHYPQTLPVLQSFGLDACCGGALELRVAAAHHNLDVEQVLNALRQAVEEVQR